VAQSLFCSRGEFFYKFWRLINEQNSNQFHRRFAGLFPEQVYRMIANRRNISLPSTFENNQTKRQTSRRSITYFTKLIVSLSSSPGYNIYMYTYIFLTPSSSSTLLGSPKENEAYRSAHVKLRKPPLLKSVDRVGNFCPGSL
jgi:hypothetical protein